MKRTFTRLVLLSVLLCACASPSSSPTPTPQAAAELDRVVSVSGKVVPASWAALSFRLGGRLSEVRVQEGQKVAAGQELAVLDSAELALAVQAATEEVAVQQALLALAQAAPAAADLAAGQAQLEAAKAALRALQEVPKLRDLEEARLQLEQAKNTLWAIQLEGDVPGLPESSQQAARARAAAAEQVVHLAELQYERVKEGASQEALASARAAVAQAEAALNGLQRGASPEELDSLRAAGRRAQVAVEQARWQLAQATLVAPFGGIVTQITARAGEMTAAGVPVFILADLDTLRVETTDLDESDLALLRVGQLAELTFDALPDDVLSAHVTHIAEMSTAGQGGNSFVLWIELDQPDPRLRWGMSAFVDILIQ
jgi:multidrug resistance efflux pump